MGDSSVRIRGREFLAPLKPAVREDDDIRHVVFIAVCNAKCIALLKASDMFDERVGKPSVMTSILPEYIP